MLRTVTCAPATTAPLGSVTVPERLAVDWLHAARVLTPSRAMVAENSLSRIKPPKILIGSSCVHCVASGFPGSPAFDVAAIQGLIPSQIHLASRNREQEPRKQSPVAPRCRQICDRCTCRVAIRLNWVPGSGLFCSPVRAINQPE